LFFLGVVATANAQENAPKKPAAARSVGLPVGQTAPAFASTDQFGRQQSIETLKGSNGTVLLFFRSADW
jgi:hypothetical protein